MAQQTKDRQLHSAAHGGELEKVKTLCSDPDVNVNWQAENGVTALYVACYKGHRHVVEHLLTHPKIDPNLAANQGGTPFWIACCFGHKEVVSVMLADARVDPNKPNNSQATPLWFASQNGHLPVVQLLLASERDIDTKTKSVSNTTAAQKARGLGGEVKKADNETEEVFQRRKKYCAAIADLIDSYEKDATRVRARLRRELGLPGTFHSLPYCVLSLTHSFSDVRSQENPSHPRREISSS